ncbi:MAG: hypothetical protein JEZ11_04850 [Desulfobacterales bacterium]|nr:hypothetical protein [Desulfobacterales bacterium]
MTHAAFHNLEGLPAPRAMGRPGIGDTAWFASLATARKMAARHPLPAEGRVFQEMAARIPDAVQTAKANIIESGRMDGAAAMPYAVFVAKVGLETGAFLYSGVTVNGTLVALTLLRKAPGSDLYKAVWAGVCDPETMGWRDKAFKRGLSRLVRRYQLKIRQYPDACIDFMGTITVGAALMGHALFKHLRKAEMERLGALGPDEYAVLRRRVVAYSYPRFEAAQLIRPMEILRGAARRAVEAATTPVKSLLGSQWRR